MVSPLSKLCCACAFVALVGAACDFGGSGAEVPVGAADLQVARISPEDVLRGQRPLLLNEVLTVHFSAPLDTHTVHEESFRVLDGAGHAVRGRVEVRRFSVSFVPEPPLEPSLTDGSFAPDRDYVLELAGFPSSSAIRGLEGQMLESGRRFEIRTVGREPGSRWPSPLLPIGLDPTPAIDVGAAGAEGPQEQDAAARRGQPSGRFEVVMRPHPVAQGAPKVKLSFTLPVLPTSVTNQAFTVYTIDARHQRRSIAIDGLRLQSRPVPIDPYPGCTLEISLAPGHGLRSGDPILLAASPSHPLLDYAGRPLDVPPRLEDPDGPRFVPVLWQVVPGDRIVLEQCPRASDRGAVYASGAGTAGWRVDTQGRLVPHVFRETGAGTVDFEPTQDEWVESGRPIPARALGGGREPEAPIEVLPGEWQFRSLHVPRGVTVTVRSTQPAVWRVLGAVRIDGVLRLETPQGSEEVPGFQLVAGGVIAIEGALEAALPPGGAGTRAVALETGSEFRVKGAVPQGTVLAGRVAPGGRLDLIVPASPRLTPGVPDGARLDCEAWTPWLSIPVDHVDRTLVRVVGASPGVSVAAQVAPPDPTTLGPPRAGAFEQPRPVRGDLILEPAPGSYVRFTIRAEVRDGAPLPRLERIELLADS